jgi:large subunit ribosomal protein L24
MRARSHLPRKQRLAWAQAAHHERRRRLTLPLSRELRSRYGRRRLPVRKGDTVRILAGSYVGREERVARVDRRHYRVVLDNVTLKKADSKLIQLPLTPGHLMITKLNLADPWRRRVLKVPEGEANTEEEGMPAPEQETPAPPSTAQPPPEGSP